MNCPKCGYSYSIVMECRASGEDQRVRKRCTNCNHRFTIFEVSQERYKTFNRQNKTISKILSLMEVLKNIENEDH